MSTQSPLILPCPVPGRRVGGVVQGASLEKGTCPSHCSAPLTSLYAAPEGRYYLAGGACPCWLQALVLGVSHSKKLEDCKKCFFSLDIEMGVCLSSVQNRAVMYIPCLASFCSMVGSDGSSVLSFTEVETSEPPGPCCTMYR
jgi:hypothetical protein